MLATSIRKPLFALAQRAARALELVRPLDALVSAGRDAVHTRLIDLRGRSLTGEDDSCSLTAR